MNNNDGTERDTNTHSGDCRTDQHSEGHLDQAASAQQPAVPTSRTVGYPSTVNEAGTTMELGRADPSDTSAAAALMQLQGSERTEMQSNDTGRITGGPQRQWSAPDMTQYHTHAHSYQSRSDTGVRVRTGNQEHSTSYPSQSSTSSQITAVQDTVINLSNVVSAMQQQQAHITNTLCNLTSMMQQSTNSGLQSHNDTQPPSNSMYNDQGNLNTDSTQSRSYVHEALAAGQQQVLYSKGDRQLPESYSRGFQQSRGVQEEQEQWGTEDRSLSYTIRDGQYRRRRQVSQTYGYTPSEVKLPLFNGKEEWKVWISRFESVAKRHHWDDETKLDNILPKLQGRAGDFVFNQLSEDTISCYPMLIKELNSRFHTVETEKTFAAKFSQRMQKNDETAEEYAAELKRLYAKAYKSRDSQTRQEDLVRRFLDGLKDHEARFEVEYHKEPLDIDTAVYHVVNFIQTRRRNSFDTYADRKYKRLVRRTSQESEAEDNDIGVNEDVDSCEYVMRLPAKEESYHGKKPPVKHNQKTETSSVKPDSKSITDLKSMIEALTSKVEALQKGARQPPEYSQKGYNTGNGTRVVCYACGVKGHIARECPTRARERGNRSNGNGQPSHNAKAGGAAEVKENPLN